MTGTYRAGFVALIGEPNAGKSTLVNALIGEKVSIVSDKPQTTRQRITGILTKDQGQIVFVDAPGVLKSSSGLNTFLQEELQDVLKNTDMLLVLMAADGTESQARDILQIAKKSGKPYEVLITKSDLLRADQPPRFLGLLIEEKVSFVSISSVKKPKETCEEVLQRVWSHLPVNEGPLYDPEIYTTQTVRQMVGEMIREQCFENLHQELPYGLAVKIMEYKEGDLVRIRAEILVDKDNHKGIVIGAKGSMLKKIGSLARAEIEQVVGTQVFLELHVSVKKQWMKNKKWLKELGYVVGKE